MSSSSTPPQGWYSDPAYPGSERRWDGEVWTEDRRRPLSQESSSPGIEATAKDKVRPVAGWGSRLATATMALGLAGLLFVLLVFVVRGPFAVALGGLFLVPSLAVLRFAWRRRARMGCLATAGLVLGAVLLGSVLLLSVWQFLGNVEAEVEAEIALCPGDQNGGLHRLGDYRWPAPVATGSVRRELSKQSPVRAGLNPFNRRRPGDCPVGGSCCWAHLGELDHHRRPVDASHR